MHKTISNVLVLKPSKLMGLLTLAFFSNDLDSGKKDISLGVNIYRIFFLLSKNEEFCNFRGKQYFHISGELLFEDVEAGPRMSVFNPFIPYI
jgi:hypothetical protein